MQLRDHLLLDLLVLEVEPRVEVLRVGEHVGDEEVEQRPQLVQVVLQRRAWVRVRARARVRVRVRGRG